MDSRYASPRTLVDTLNWEDQLIPRLLGNKDRRQTYLDNCCMGLHVDSFFSGIGTVEVVAHTLVDDLRCRGFKDVLQPSCGVAYDCAQECQMVLLNMGSSSPQHVFGNIEKCIPQHYQDEISALLPDFDRHRKLMRGASKLRQAAILKENIARMKLVADFLDDHGASIFAEDRTACCVKHGNDGCPGMQKQSSKFHVCGLGSVCVAWSPRGLSDGIVHESFLALLLAVHEILSILPLIVLHECVPNFPVAILRSLLGHKYRLIVFPDVSPQQLGHPVERKRQYILLVLMEQVVCTASVEQFYEIFFKQVEADGSIYFVATNSMLQEANKKKALRRHMSDTASCRQLDTLKTQERWEEYEALIIKERANGSMTEDNLFWDNIHHAGHAAKPSPLIPCLTRNSQIASRAHDRRAIGREHLLMQGVCSMSVPGVRRPCPWRHLIEYGTLSNNELALLAGNAMHQAVLAALLSYALATCTRVSPPSVHAERPSSSSSSTAENCDECEVVQVKNPPSFWADLLSSFDG